MVLKFSFVTHLLLAFPSSDPFKGLRMSPGRGAPFRDFSPLKFSLLESFPFSLRTKKRREGSPLLFRCCGRGMQTLPRHLESLSPSRDASPPPPAPITRPIPFSNVTKIILSPPPWAPLVITPWKLDTKREAWQSYVCYVFRARPRISPIDCNPFSSPTDSVERAITRLLEEKRRARMISPCGDRVALTPHNGVVIPVSPSSQQVDSPTLANFCLEFPRNCRGRPLAFHPISFDTFPSFPPN